VEFQVPWRQVDDQPFGLSEPPALEFRRQNLDVPVVEKAAARIQLAETPVQEGMEVILQKKAVFGAKRARDAIRTAMSVRSCTTFHTGAVVAGDHSGVSGDDPVRPPCVWY
jgi:hypothetical protein